MWPTTLPRHQGKYPVAYVDVETSPKNEKSHGVLCRIYYPTTDSDAGKSSWIPQKWIYTRGYGDFLKLPRALSMILMYPFMRNINIPVARNAPLRSEDVPSNLPVAIFSHGLGGMRTTYSNFCGNIASRGFVVIVPEHSDGTASFTVRNGDKTPIPYFRPSLKDKLEGETVDEGLLRIRTGQLDHRREEIVEAVQMIEELNLGTLSHVLNVDVNKKEQTMHDKIVQSFKSRLDLNNMVITGHSFGAATAIHTLNLPNKFKCAVLLDPWMFAVPSTSFTEIPTINLQSHIFHWKTNLEQLKDYVKHPKSHPENIFGFVKNTKHQDVSDFKLAFPNLLKLVKAAGDTEPQVVHQVVDHLCLNFMSKYVETPLQLKSELDLKIEDYVTFGDEAFEELYQSFK